MPDACQCFRHFTPVFVLLVPISLLAAHTNDIGNRVEVLLWKSFEDVEHAEWTFLFLVCGDGVAAVEKNRLAVDYEKLHGLFHSANDGLRSTVNQNQERFRGRKVLHGNRRTQRANGPGE